LELLKPHLSTRSTEVFDAVTEAISSIERAQIGEEQWLQVDRNNPYDQVKRVWAQLTPSGFHEIRRDNSLRERAIQWHRSFVAAMPELKFASDKERGHAWAMLGTLIFYFLNPEQRFMYKEDIEHCPEAVYCYEQCLKYTPDRTDIQKYLRSVR